mmetsp:Transcript_29414/g.76308  ORF Transcript_29414/g.76308 Transcript_29414/m.76308 type:complete len:200 (-) Transcript_29414:605-1204(-)
MAATSSSADMTSNRESGTSTTCVRGRHTNQIMPLRFAHAACALCSRPTTVCTSESVTREASMRAPGLSRGCPATRLPPPTTSEMESTWSFHTRDPKKCVKTPRPWSATMAKLLGNLALTASVATAGAAACAAAGMLGATTAGWAAAIAAAAGAAGGRACGTVSSMSFNSLGSMSSTMWKVSSTSRKVLCAPYTPPSMAL